MIRYVDYGNSAFYPNTIENIRKMEHDLSDPPFSPKVKLADVLPFHSPPPSGSVNLLPSDEIETFSPAAIVIPNMDEGTSNSNSEKRVVKPSKILYCPR